MAPLDQFVKSAWMLGSIAVVVAALYLAKGVLVPLTLAVLLSFLLSPVCDWLERRRLGRIPAVLLTAFLGFAVLGIAAWTAVVQMTALAPKMPEYQANLQAKLHSVNDYFIAALSKVTRTAEDIGQNLPQAATGQGAAGDRRAALLGSRAFRAGESPATPGRTFGTLIEVLGLAGIVVILVVFFLVRREDLRDRFIRLVGKGQVTVTTQMLEDAATRVSRYLSMLFLINTTFRHCGRHRALPDRSTQRHPVGDPGRNLEVRSLHRPVDCRCGADLPGDGHLDGLAGAHPHAGAVCGPGTLLRECPGALAVWQGHRRVGGGGPGGGRLLDMVVGNCGTAAGDPA